MKIGIVTPAPPGSNYGNRVTAVRWAKILRKLGHQVSIAAKYDGQPFAILIALHARRSSSSIKRWKQKNPDAPLIVALTGTDLYRDFQNDTPVQKSLGFADRIVVLQPWALKQLNRFLQKKTCVIFQSVEAKLGRPDRQRSPRAFDVCVIGHLRVVKDPFRAALASRLLPATSQIRIRQIGEAMTKQMRGKARDEMKINPRYRWLGALPRARALRSLAESDLCVISSGMEGGANVLSEAIVAGVPVLASRIDGNVGILGPDYPGLFPVGDTRQLARLLIRTENDPKFLIGLRTRVKRLAPLFDPGREERAWSSLLDEISI